MMASAPRKTPHPTTATDIRTRAVVAALLLVPVGSVIGVAGGAAWGQAVSTSALGSLAGLACWTVYHLVCRQNNGLIICSGFLAPLIGGTPRSASSWACLLSLAALSGLMFGAWARWRDGLPGEPARTGVDGR